MTPFVKNIHHDLTQGFLLGRQRCFVEILGNCVRCIWNVTILLHMCSFHFIHLLTAIKLIQ
ncbi:hypothetical protein UUU_11750 [Klebsiella pneumoniae subsp. pneumoniae DSM 30104 = JCM 1662 = NBRC 14940]|nr:hypothetical protein UUU_11750 [Klebsiella pneumoniae subsp. pneumoniae DSM 30104 = JCM 1662 = NBRC 14940]